MKVNKHQAEAHLKRFASLDTDKRRWEYLINNAKTTSLIVQLDNDDTLVVSNHEDVEECAFFDSYIGDSDGVIELLSTLNIPAELV